MAEFIIGDVHGCGDELEELIEIHDKDFPDHEILSIGDLYERGPKDEKVWAIFKERNIRFVRGNHDDKLLRWCKGNNVVIGAELKRTIEALGLTNEDKKIEMFRFLSLAPEEMKFSNLRLVHAQPYGPRMYGEKREYKNQAVRYPWWKTWNGHLTIFGHYWFDEPLIGKNAVGIDTSCCAGGKLSAFVFPEFEIIQVNSTGIYHSHVSGLKELEMEYWRTFDAVNI